jgi:hypothetical protein
LEGGRRLWEWEIVVIIIAIRPTASHCLCLSLSGNKGAEVKLLAIAVGCLIEGSKRAASNIAIISGWTISDLRIDIYATRRDSMVS